MKNLGMEVDIRNGKAKMSEFGGEMVDIREDKKGHLRIKLGKKMEKNKVWLGEEWWENVGKRKEKLKKLHFQFGHPGWERLFRLIKEAKVDQGNKDEGIERELKNETKDISENCEICKKYKRTPARPVVGMQWAQRFNELVAMDLGDIDGKLFLVMIDVATKYCQAIWVNNKKPEEINGKFIIKWVSIFGAPQNLITDNGKEFQNEKSLNMTEKLNIKMRSTPAESPWSNGVCEKWVGLIKDSLRKMNEEGMPYNNVTLSWVVSAKNSLINNKGYSPNQLVFGKNPILPNVMGECSPAMCETENEEDTVRENLIAMKKAREVHIQQEASSKIKRALKGNIREHKLESAEVGKEVYYKREGENEWRGPAKVIGRDGKTVIVKHGGLIRTIARVHITRIQRADEEQESTSMNDDENGDGEEMTDQMNEDENQIEENESEMEMEEENVTLEKEDEIPHFKKGDLVVATSRETKKKEKWQILSLAGKRNSKKWNNCYNVKDIESDGIKWIDLRNYEDIGEMKDKDEEEEILLGFDEDEILDAKMKELKSWEENNVFREEPNGGQRTISVRWIITEKYKEGKKQCKARLVVRGFEEKDSNIKTDSPTCSPEVLKFCLSIMKMKDWECNSLDVKTAFLQGDSMERDVYVKPPVESGSKGIWKLMKTVYGLKDAPRAWYEKLKKVVLELNGIMSKLEPIVFYWKNDSNELIGIMCAHVDDFCFGGNEEFQKNVIKKLSERLKVGQIERKQFKYIGVEIQESKNCIEMKQEKYEDQINVPKLKNSDEGILMTEEELTTFRSLIGQLNWLAQHTRPELSFLVSHLSRSFQGGPIEDLQRAIKIANKIKGSEGLVRLQKVQEGVFWEVYADASFGSGEEGHSQLGFIICLKDEKGNKCPIQWKSQKSKRVAKSTIEAESLAIGEAAEACIYLNELWYEAFGRRMKVSVKTDSKTLEKAAKSTTSVRSRKLRIKISALREMLETGEINDLQWVDTKSQIADVFTKEGVCPQHIQKYVAGQLGNKEEGEKKRE